MKSSKMKKFLGKAWNRSRNVLFDVKIYVKDFFFPHNVVRCANLTRSWVDRDDVMFHAMFQVLVDFVELEQPFCEYEKRFKRKRFTDVQQMDKYLEQVYNTPAGRASFYWDQISEEDKVKIDESTNKRYLIEKEILYLYKWYKDECYQLDTWALHLKCDTRYKFVDGRLVRLPSPDPSFITVNEVAEIEDEHQLICDRMLERILAIRRNLWT